MIYTCTLNPSVDYQIDTDQITLGDLNRVRDTAFYPGGKGINVSRVLKNLGTESVALGFIGGFTGAFITNSLKDAGIYTGFMEHDEPTRVNVKVKATSSETEINGSGANIPEALRQNLLKKIGQLTADDFLIVSGSRPPSIPFSFYKDIAMIAAEKRIQLVLDIPDVQLVELLSYRPFMLKPNEHELSQMLDRPIRNEEEAIAGAKELVKKGAQHVVVSLGAEGAVLVTNELELHARPPEGELKSSVGAGDSLVAGFLAAYLQGRSVEKAFQSGVAAGSATAYSDNLVEQQLFDVIYPQVKITNRKGVDRQ